MEMQIHNTKTFNDIFPTVEVFKNWWSEYGLPEIKDLTFKLIQSEYRVSHIAYDEISFKDHFFIDLYTYVKEFEQTTDAIDKLMALTDDEISTSGAMILNVADIPERESSTDAEFVNFISQQQKTVNKKGVLQIKREQLSNKRVYTVKSFLKKFKHLFITILSSAYTPVIEEPEGV